MKVTQLILLGSELLKASLSSVQMFLFLLFAQANHCTGDVKYIYLNGCYDNLVLLLTVFFLAAGEGTISFHL